MSGQPENAPGTNPYYSAQGGLYTGVVHVICGVISVILSILSIGFSTVTGRHAAGIWCGISFFVVTGILGIFSAKRNRGIIIGYMIMCLITTFVAGCCSLSYAISAAFENEVLLAGRWFASSYAARLTLDLFMLTVCIAEFINSIIGAAFCCSGAPCRGPPQQQVQHPVGYAQVHRPQQTVITNSPQGMTTYTTTTYSTNPGYTPQPTAPVAAYNYNTAPPAYEVKY